MKSANITRVRVADRTRQVVSLFAVALALLASPFALSQQWQGGNGIYLNNTGDEVGQTINFRNAGDASSTQKAFFTNGTSIRVLEASVVSADPDLGVVQPIDIEGDSCIVISTENSLGNYNNAMTIRVVAQDKTVRSGLVSEVRDLVSIQGAAPSAPSCESNDPPRAEVFTTAQIPQTHPGFAVDLSSRISDADEDTISITLVQIYVASGNPADVGTVTTSGTGFTFIPNRSFSGTAVIAYHVSDGNYSVTGGAGPSPTLWMQGQVSIPVTDVNLPPVASDDSTATDFEQPVTINVLNNDTDADGDTLTITGVTQPDFGGADIVNNQILYTPPESFSGEAHFSYTISDGTATATADVTVTVRDSDAAPNEAPTVSIPAATNGVLNFADTNQAAGENVTIVSQANDPEGAQLTWTWIVDGTSTTTQQPSLQVSLADGTHSLQLSVSDGELTSSTVTVSVVVAAAVANTLPTLTLTTSTGDTLFVDTDLEPGESVGITATATDSDGTIVAASYRWTVNSTAIAALNGQASATLDLNDGDSTVSVTVTDNSGGSRTTSITITVAAPIPTLESVAANPVQAAVGRSVDTLCPMLNGNAGELTGDAPDLLGQCTRIIGNSANPDQQQQALQALAGEELQAAQTASINFGKVQSSNIAARLQALRAGARGVSVTGLNLSYEGEAVPISAIGQAAKALGLVTGRCDNDDLTNQRLGIFLNGKIGFGEKDTTQNETGYDYDSIGATLGMDYRFTDSFIAGLAVGYSDATADFVADQGNLDSNGLSGTLFSSWYKGRGYFDLLAGYGQVDYDSLRHINYQIGTDIIDREASGSTDGTMTTAGLSFGYELGKKGWAITPNASISYMKVEIDGFTESGSQGLDLEYGDQSADSMQYQAGLQAGYHFSPTWGVITPQVYGSYVVDKQEIGGVFLRFANDPFSGSPSQPGSDTVFFVTGDEPDEEYFRWGVSVSAVFKNMVSAFINYESYAGMDTISYSEVTVGIRMQTSF